MIIDKIKSRILFYISFAPVLYVAHISGINAYFRKDAYAFFSASDYLKMSLNRVDQLATLFIICVAAVCGINLITILAFKQIADRKLMNDLRLKRNLIVGFYVGLIIAPSITLLDVTGILATWGLPGEKGPINKSDIYGIAVSTYALFVILCYYAVRISLIKDTKRLQTFCLIDSQMDILIVLMLIPIVYSDWAFADGRQAPDRDIAIETCLDKEGSQSYRFVIALERVILMRSKDNVSVFSYDCLKGGTIKR